MFIQVRTNCMVPRTCHVHRFSWGWREASVESSASRASFCSSSVKFCRNPSRICHHLLWPQLRLHVLFSSECIQLEDIYCCVSRFLAPHCTYPNITYLITWLTPSKRLRSNVSVQL